MSFSNVSGNCAVCEHELTMQLDQGYGEYYCGGRMDPMVALMSHGAIVVCPQCKVSNVFKTDFLGDLYLEVYDVH